MTQSRERLFNYAALKMEGPPSVNIDQEILQKAEENEGETDLFTQIVEDTEEIFKIFFEELNSPTVRINSQKYYAQKAKRNALKKKE